MYARGGSAGGLDLGACTTLARMNLVVVVWGVLKHRLLTRHFPLAHNAAAMHAVDVHSQRLYLRFPFPPRYLIVIYNIMYS